MFVNFSSGKEKAEAIPKSTRVSCNKSLPQYESWKTIKIGCRVLEGYEMD